MDQAHNKKRNTPPLWQHDFHVLRRLRKGIDRFAKKCGKSHNLIIADYGCGTLPYKDIFIPYAKKYIGIDIGKNLFADICIKESERIPIASGSIDIVLSTQVLEHVNDVRFYLSECERIVKHNGVIILSTHGIWPYHPYPIDCHRWTKEGLILDVERHSFRVDEVLTILGSFASVTQYTMLLLAAYLIQKGIIGRVMLAVLSIVGNWAIWIEDMLFPVTKTSDGSLYIVFARKK